MSPTAVDVHHLSVVRGRRTVITDLTCSIAAGTVTGLLGPSGCGKSTLMRAIVGVQDGISGDVSVLGLPAGAAVLRTRVGYVTQAPSVYDDLTVTENVRFFASILGASSTEVGAVVTTVGLGPHADDVVGRLSGGQRSRVSLAVALLGRPDVLVLDEPTVGLDPVLREELWGTFHELAANGVAVLVSSHVMDEAERCDQLLLMREGRLIATGAPEAIKAQASVTSVEQAFLRIVRGAP